MVQTILTRPFHNRLKSNFAEIEMLPNLNYDTFVQLECVNSNCFIHFIVVTRPFHNGLKLNFAEIESKIENSPRYLSNKSFV